MLCVCSAKKNYAVSLPACSFRPIVSPGMFVSHGGFLRLVRNNNIEIMILCKDTRRYSKTQAWLACACHVTGGRGQHIRFGWPSDHCHYDITAKEAPKCTKFSKMASSPPAEQSFGADFSNHSSFKWYCIWIS